MERFIGLDVHASSTTMAVVGASGKRLGSKVVETAAASIVEQLCSWSGTTHVALEEGTQSEWLYEVISPHVAQVVVLHLDEKSSRGQKNDSSDAFGLAERLRTGSFNSVVYKSVGVFATLRQLCRVHSKVVGDTVRVQNRLKAVFRSRGIAVDGRGVYGQSKRQSYLSALPLSCRGAALVLYAEFDALKEIGQQAEQDLVAESHRHPASRILESCPGMGPIRVAQALAVIVSPRRFRTRQQLWSYSGLGIVMRSSSDWIRQDGNWMRAELSKTRGLNRNFNRLLKRVFKGAATTVITLYGTDEPLRRDYERLLAAGTKPNLAKLTLARKIAATVWSMWKKEESYNPQAQTTSKHS